MALTAICVSALYLYYHILSIADSLAVLLHLSYVLDGHMEHPTAGCVARIWNVGNDVGPAPHPSLNHFFLEKRNGLEIQRKSLSLAVAGCLVV